MTALNQTGFRYMLTGAMASSYYGRPRSTHDIDVVIHCKQRDLAKLARGLAKAGFDVDAMTLLKSWVSDYRIATINDRHSPHTLDLIFTQERLHRRTGRIVGVPTYYETAESLILAKLRMLKVTIDAERSAIDRADIKAVLRTTRVNLKSLRKSAKSQSTYGTLKELIGSLSETKPS